MLLTERKSADGYYGYETTPNLKSEKIYGVLPNRFEDVAYRYFNGTLTDAAKINTGLKVDRLLTAEGLSRWLLNNPKLNELVENSGVVGGDRIITTEYLLKIANLIETAADEEKIDKASASDYLGYIFDNGFMGITSKELDTIFDDKTKTIDGIVEIPSSKDSILAVFAFEYNTITNSFWALCSYSYNTTSLKTVYKYIGDKNQVSYLTREELEAKGLNIKDFQKVDIRKRFVTVTNNEFMYVPVSDIDLNPLYYKLPREILNSATNVKADILWKNNVDMEHIEGEYKVVTPYDSYAQNQGVQGHESLGEVWIATKTARMMTAAQIILESCERTSGKRIVSGATNTFIKEIPKNSLVSVLVNKDGWPVTVNLKPSRVNEMPNSDYNTYMVVIYNGVCRYVLQSNFRKNTDGVPLLVQWNEQKERNTGPDVSVEKITLKSATAVMDEKQVLKYGGSNKSNIEQRNYIRMLNRIAYVVGYEEINGTKFLLTWKTAPKGQTNGNSGIAPFGFDHGYIPYDMTTEDEYNNTTDEYFTYWIGNDKKDKDETGVNLRDTANYDKTDNYSDGYDNKNRYTIGESSLYSNVTATDYGQIELGGYRNPNKWYNVQLEAGKYPDNIYDENKTAEGRSPYYSKAAGFYYLENESDTRLPSQWGDTDLLGWDLYHSLQRYPMMYLPQSEGGHTDKRHINKINRFKFITDMSGLSTKSFIFMTKPDLNIFDKDENGALIPNKMNPDLRRIPEFKYIGRNKDVGWNIIDSLEYWSSDSGNTPWLSIITNQAEGYTPIDREIGYTEVGETYHGHKVLYGKHDFKHNIAGTVSIPFSERRDLSLYYTLKIWTEYIHCINLGLVSPNYSHIKNAELDYAVSLFYIQTDETMENILYWEKLTGVFPLKCPDSFFSWDKGNSAKSMEYTIDFAYSMRTVLKSNDLNEINRLYMKGSKIDDKLTYPFNKDFLNDDIENRYLAKMIAYFGNNKINMDKVYESGAVGYVSHTKNYETDGDEFNDFVTKLINGTEDISKYYYETYEDANGTSAKYLANYIPEIQSHGIPYVKGPFIVPHRAYNGGKYLLKWV